jgi:hypothetical protein
MEWMSFSEPILITVGVCARTTLGAATREAVPARKWRRWIIGMLSRGFEG